MVQTRCVQPEIVGHDSEATKSQFTPGPWRVFTTADGLKLVGIGTAEGDGIADCGFGIWRGGDAEAIANANLIAAAPDLLAALERARESVWAVVASTKSVSFDADLRAVDFAIAKAKGLPL